LPPKGRQGGFGGGVCVTDIPAHESRQFWLTVHAPDKCAPGTYSGNLMLEVKGARRGYKLPIELQVLPIELKPVEGNYSIFYPSQPVDPKTDNYVTPQRYLSELRDMVRHGLNAVTLYGGETTMHYAAEAGMTEAPCIMHWPDGGEVEELAEAKKLGFADLDYYGVDEPHGDRIEVCRKEAERRLKGGWHTYTAINSVDAWQATKDLIDRPVYNLYVFGGKDAEAAMYARSKGFKPVSYWTTAVSYPLWYRALAGLYNTACGYLGTAPWAYEDFPDNRLYDVEQGHVHAVSYPDEFGEPIPTLRWEAHREGIDDVRYLQALDRVLRAAEERLQKPDPPAGLAAALAKAKDVRKARYESIGGRWFEYLNGLKPDTLDATRHEMAMEIVALGRLLHSR
ncbi:MAG: DUF4091 domain-containing protein, partial [Armatimonadetes bacterium]|nr:DUF4091 domain-containing protein [Armatimonadota bacterium]